MFNWKDPKVLAVGGVVVVGGYAYYKSRSASSSATTSTTADPTGASSALGDANLQSAVYDPLESQISSLAGADAQTYGKLASLASIVNKLTHAPKAASPKPTSVTPKPPPAKTVPIAKATPIVKTPATVTATPVKVKG